MMEYRQRKWIVVAARLLIVAITALLTTPRVNAAVSTQTTRQPAAFRAPATSQTLAVQVPNSQPKQGFIINHQSVALFEQIPDNYLTAAREMGVLFSDRSVGQNIHQALNCLTAKSWETSSASCRRDYYDAGWNWKVFTGADRSKGLVPARILFDPDPDKYSRTNWTFEFKAGSWSELTQDFIQVLAPAYIDSKDVLSYQFGYLNVSEGSDIVDPTTGFFADNADKYDVYDLEAYIAQHPDKVFVFWTISLARGIGTQASTDFNNQLRAYALEHDKILFDMADIVAHTDQGVACYDNRDGVEYCSKKGKCENHPDDGQELPAICQDYTTETDGGHLGSVSGAKIRIAKAFWVMMARVAGWDGSVTSSVTPSSTVEPISAPISALGATEIPLQK
ncbi:MAG: hypothetical protein IT328_14765 [Caldilineaceae bacterium]|nr:hypothetical protein [Caldilineaceae bacterium]